MKIGIGQINMDLGHVDKNLEKVQEVIKELGPKSDVIVFPELTLPGSPWNDLYENEYFVEQQMAALKKVHEQVQWSKHDITVLLWYLDPDMSKKQAWGSIRKYNAGAAISKEGIRTSYKQNVCDYDIFYEGRQTTPWRKWENFNFGNDLRGTLTICEDLWDENYDYKPLDNRKMDDVDAIFNLSSSPFADWKLERRIHMLSWHAKKRNKDLVYLNQIGGQDDSVFDWWSMIYNWKGELIHLSPFFKEDIQVIDTKEKHEDLTEKALEISRNKYEQMYWAIVLWLKDYLKKTWLSKVVIGVSGGIDSAFSLYFLRQVLDAENIVALYMPTKHSTNSQTDAHTLAKNLWVTLNEVPVQDTLNHYVNKFKERHWKAPEGITYENIQARIRGEILMEESNNTPWSMIINNSNKTEMLLWYWTLHWDMIGAFNLIGDINKKELYEFAKYINKKEKNDVIPSNIITKKASAELQDEQVDPFDYPRVSDAVDALWNGKMPQQVILDHNLTLEEAMDFAKKIRYSEYKRREYYPMILKMKQRHMWLWRRYPVARGI